MEHLHQVLDVGVVPARHRGVVFPDGLSWNQTAEGELEDLHRRRRSRSDRNEDALARVELDLAETLPLVVPVGNDGTHAEEARWIVWPANGSGAQQRALAELLTTPSKPQAYTEPAAGR